MLISAKLGLVVPGKAVGGSNGFGLYMEERTSIRDKNKETSYNKFEECITEANNLCKRELV